MSAAVPARPMTCSGAMNPAEPTVMPVLVRLVVSSAWAMPKSMTFGPPAVSSTLDGLRSRCTIPAAWIAVSASASPVARPYSIRGSIGPWAATYSDSEGPSAYSVTRNGLGAWVSASITRIVHTPWTRVSTATSRPNLTRNSGSSASSGRSTFTATRWPWSSPRYTTPIPPAPSRAASRYRPTCAGSVCSRGARANESPLQAVSIVIAGRRPGWWSRPGRLELAVRWGYEATGPGRQAVLNWANYVALGDSLTAGRDDHGPGGARIGWARRLAGILSARTAVPCALTNLAFDGASVAAVLEQQLPAVARIRPDLVSVTVGMNDIRDPAFSPDGFAAGLEVLLDGLASTGATVLTCTLPDIAAIMSLPACLAELARLRMRQASDVIREQAARRGAVCLDAWAMPGAADPELFGPDRIHPNGRGHQLMADAFAALLLPATP